MTDIQQHDDKPWYQQFWPWLLILLPASAVIGGIATIIIANYNPDGVVVDNYYKEGLAINRDLARDRNAVNMGLQARLHIDAGHQKISLHLKARQKISSTELQLQLLHPTLSHHDQKIMLRKTGEGLYEGYIRLPATGQWNLILEPRDHQWRLTQRIQLELDKDLMLRQEAP